MAQSLKMAIWSLLGVSLVGCGTTNTAEQRLANVLTTQERADDAYRSGDMEHAAVLYRQLTSINPQEADYWYVLGNTYVRTQQPDQAVQAYQEAIMRNPNHARAWHNLGIVRMRQAMAAFVSSASTAKAGDPMYEVSTQLANELARIGSARETTGNVPDQVSKARPLPVSASSPTNRTAAGVTATRGVAAAKTPANDPYLLRRRPGATTSTDQP